MAGPWEAFQQAPAAAPKADGPWSHFQPATGEPMSWGSVAGQAISNIPSSAYNMAAGIANTIMHPIETAQSIYDVGKGAVSKAAGALGVEQDSETKAQNEAAINAVGQFFADRYGGMENFKKTIATDPVGFAMDLSTILSGGGAALARVPGATRAANAVGKAAELTNPVSLAGKAASGVAEPVVSGILGMTTGAGTQPIRQAARAGYDNNTVFTDNMRGNVPMSDTVDMAKSALGGMRNDRAQAYQATMASANASTGHVGYQPIHKALSDADQMVNFQGLSKSAEASKTLEQIQDLVSQWRGLQNPHSVEAADALKQAIGEIYTATKPNTLSQKVAKTVYDAAKSSIVQQAPEYAKAMADYSSASEKINEVQRTLSLGQRTSEDTALRKLQSVMRNNVNTNYGNRMRLVDDLAQYEPDLPVALAGQALNSATPRGLVRGHAVELGTMGAAGAAFTHMINPMTLAMAPAFSPRLVGEAAYAGGRGANALMPVAQYAPDAAMAGNAVNVLSNVGQNSLSGGIGPRYDANGNLIQ